MTTQTQTVLQFDEPIRRPRARTSDPETSHEAAQSVTNLSDKQRSILRLLRDGPGTDGELWEHLSKCTFVGISESGARTRRKELVDMNLVRDSGRRHQTRSRRNAIVWEAV